MHIGIAAPVATEYVAACLDGDTAHLPAGYAGAPLTGVLIGELLRRGVRVTAFTTDASLPLDGPPVRARGERFELVVCPARPRAWRFDQGAPGRALDGFARERHALRRAIAEAAPDLVHAHWTYEFALAALDTGLPHLVTCHDDPAAVLRFTRSPYRAVRYLMARQVFGRARNLTTVSAYMVDALRKHTRAPLTIVPNPLAPQVYALGRERALPGSRRIAMVSNGWDRRKNPAAALRAFAHFRARHAGAELHAFGKAFGFGETAQTWAGRHGVADGVVFHGAVPHRELIARLDGMDAFLHPALEESFGVVVAEAMALGLPVVAGADSGAVPWVLRGDRGGDAAVPGRLVDVRSPQAMADALDDVFGADYAAYSRRGRRRAADFSAAAIVETYLGLYRRVLAGDGAARRTADAAAPGARA